MEAREGEGRAPNRGPTSWTARIVAPLALAIVAAALVVVITGTVGSSDDDDKRDDRGQTASNAIASRTPSRPSRRATT